jgi:CheY-like chemotaxis protein
LLRYSKIVLLVDDDPADQKLFSRELEKHGFRVIITASPENAMAAIVGGGIGCLVTDQIMPVKGGELATLAAGVRGDLSIVVFSVAPARRMNPYLRERSTLIRTILACSSRLSRNVCSAGLSKASRPHLRAVFGEIPGPEESEGLTRFWPV